MELKLEYIACQNRQKELEMRNAKAQAYIDEANERLDEEDALRMTKLMFTFGAVILVLAIVL